MKKVKDPDFPNISFDSTHEMYFYWYLQTLLKSGYAKELIFDTSYNLTNKVTHPFLDSKDKPKDMLLFNSTTYTEDFCIKWNPAAKNIFYHVIGERPTRRCFFKATTKDGEDYTNIDIKNPHNKQGVKTLFSIKQRWIYDKLNVYVQEVEFYPLFLQTFTPKRYTFTDNKEFMRKLDYEPTTFKEFINRVK